MRQLEKYEYLLSIWCNLVVAKIYGNLFKELLRFRNIN